VTNIRRNTVRPKRLLQFTDRHDVISQKTPKSRKTVVRNSDFPRAVLFS